MATRLATALCLLVCAIAFAAVVSTAGQPIDHLQKHLVVDDAIYYVKPALQLVDGHGYAFDGVHRTNGVQPLWAMVVAGLAFLVPDADALLRALVLLSGGLWIVGGWLLFLLLRPLHAFAGAIGAMVWLMAGFEVRLSMMGMENGLHGCVLALSLWTAQRLAALPADDPRWHQRAFAFGTAAALLSLARIECGLLAALWAFWVAWRQRADGSFVRGCLRAWSYALPLLLIGGLWVGFSRYYFGEWTPVSGAVKAWNVATGGEQAPLADRALASLRQSAWLSLSGIAILLQEHLVPRLQRLPTPEEWAYGLLACFLPLLAGIPRLFRPSRWPANTAPRALLFVFVLAHLGLVAWLLAPYASYCTWYFTPEILFTSLFLGAVVGSLSTWWRWLLALPLAAVVLTSTALRVPTWFQAPATGVTAPYVDTGRWLEAWLPPGATIGCFASGYIALEAASHRVVNLDGLINDGRYLREYVTKHRIPEYFRDEGIGYFADNLPMQQWQTYVTTDAPMLPKDLRPLHCWPTAPGQAVAVLAVPVPAANAPAHPLGAVFFRALALGELPTVADADRPTIAADQQIAGSYLDPASGALRHIALPRTALAAAVDRAGVAHLGTREVDFQGQCRLLGHEVVPATGLPGSRTLVRVYLEAGPAIDAAAAYELALQIGAAGGGTAPWSTTQPIAHGTQPAGSWPSGELRCHTFLVDLPAGFPSGRQPLLLAVRKQGGEATPPVWIGLL